MPKSYERCYADHRGPWLIEPSWIQSAVRQIRAGLWQTRTRSVEEEPAWELLVNGIAYVPIMGAIHKGFSKYGGASSVAIRGAVRDILRSADTRAAVLHIDSPGGAYAGTSELARDVARLAAAKPTVAVIEDLGASAAYWVASQTRRIWANSTAEVGSIGTYAVIEDTSGMAAAEGIVVHVISTGPYKGLGEPGTPVTSQFLEYQRSRVVSLNEFFLQAVGEGRRQPPEKVAEWADGRVWGADEAKSMGLIDEVGTMDDAMSYLLAQIVPAPAPHRGRIASEAIALEDGFNRLLTPLSEPLP